MAGKGWRTACQGQTACESPTATVGPGAVEAAPPRRAQWPRGILKGNGQAAAAPPRAWRVSGSHIGDSHTQQIPPSLLPTTPRPCSLFPAMAALTQHGLFDLPPIDNEPMVSGT